MASESTFRFTPSDGRRTAKLGMYGGKDMEDTWILHATPAWSQENAELRPEDVADLLMDHLLEVLE